MLYETTMRPAAFSLWERHPNGLSPMKDVSDIAEFTAYMDREYEWEWADDLDGKIKNQNDGRPFRWRRTPGEEWTYGLLYDVPQSREEADNQ